MSITKLRLIDGPLVPSPHARAITLEAMASDLVRWNAYAVRGDAIRSLFREGYGADDVKQLVDEARALAAQVMVAEAMSDQ